jgi:D-hexose-6-phosphate mutarotase
MLTFLLKKRYSSTNQRDTANQGKCLLSWDPQEQEKQLFYLFYPKESNPTLK